MKDDKKIKIEELVKSYYNIYKEYKDTFYKNEPKREDIVNKFKPFVENNDSSSEDFIETAKKLYIDRTIMWTDLNFYKTKFLNAVNLYTLTQEEELSDEILGLYLKEKTNEYKPMFAVEKGKFVETVEQDAKKIPQEEYDNILKVIEYQIKLEENK